MAKGYHIYRSRGNLLPRALPPEPQKPCVIYKIDIDYYNKTGELLSPEEVNKLRETEADDLVTSYPDAMKERIAEMIRRNKTCGEIHLAITEEFPERPVSYNALSVKLADMRKKLAKENIQNKQGGIKDMKNKTIETEEKPDCFGQEESCDKDCNWAGECLNAAYPIKPDCFGNQEKHTLCIKKCDQRDDCRKAFTKTNAPDITQMPLTKEETMVQAVKSNSQVITDQVSEEEQREGNFLEEVILEDIRRNIEILRSEKYRQVDAEIQEKISALFGG